MITSGILDCAFTDTPIAVVDFETTGLTAGSDRVVEASVVRIDPGQQPELIFDTLVNPGRRVAATEIHGITDEDVADAPAFDEVAGDFVRAIAGAVVAAYNVYFDIKFLEYELRTAGVACEPPHFCLMYLRPMLGLGRRCSLEEACQACGVEHSAAHVASTDCAASAALMQRYLDEMHSRDIRTFGQMAALKDYKFVRSFGNPPLAPSVAAGRPTCKRTKSRAARIARSAPHDRTLSATRRRPENALKVYWDALRTVVGDLEVTDAETRYLAEKKRELKLADEEVRVLHARAFASAISRFVDDHWLDHKKMIALRRLRECLSRLGWAPGD